LAAARRVVYNQDENKKSGSAMKKILQLVAAAWVVTASIVYYLQYSDKIKLFLKHIGG
jgi:hypothetical protein